MSDVKKLQLTLIESTAGRLKSHIACVRGLGLRRMHHTVQVEDTLANRGMVNKITYLLDVKEA
jgi:large subunit ribosomal protein L30